MTDTAKPFYLFTDASFEASTAAGIGAMVLLSDLDEKNLAVETSAFEAPTIAQLEIKTALWGMSEYRRLFFSPGVTKLLLFTDCATIEKLPGRRKRLEAVNFVSKRKGTELPNAALYRDFFAACDELSPTIFWTKGHTVARDRNRVETIFSAVDHAAREGLREMRNGKKEISWR